MGIQDWSATPPCFLQLYKKKELSGAKDTARGASQVLQVRGEAAQVGVVVGLCQVGVVLV